MKKIFLPNVATALLFGLMLCCMSALCQINPLKMAKKAAGPPKRDSITDNVVVEKINFETNDDLQGWKAVKGNLQLSEAHFKDGKKSLLWDWKKGATLEISGLKGLAKAADFYPGGIPEQYEPAYYPKARYGGIKMWVYQEKAQAANMIFQVGSDIQSARSAPKYRFAVHLNFTGWRAIWVNFEEDAKVKNYKGSDVMTCIYAYPEAKSAITNGRLFIDHFSLLTFISNKRHSDMQIENHKLDIRSEDSYEILGPYEAYLKHDFSQAGVNKAALAANSKTIADRLEFLILGDGSKDWQKRKSEIEKDLDSKIKKADKFYQNLDLKNVNGYINGKPMFAIRDEHPAAEGLEYQLAAQSLVFLMAIDYRLNKSDASKDKLVNTLDYFQDQGWAAGSATGTVDHVIRLNPIANSIFLIRDELARQHKLQSRIDMLVWHARLGSLLNIDYTSGENTDKVRGTALVKLITILMMGNDSKKKILLEDYKKYMDYVIGYAPGYSDTFKPDYSIYHHRGTYLNTYGANAVATMALIHWLLQDTPYALSANSTRILKAALIKQSQIAFGVDLHYGVCGRLTLNNSAIDGFLLPAYAFMASGQNGISDTSLAQRFNYLYTVAKPKEINTVLTPALTYLGTLGTLEVMVRLHEQCAGKMMRPEDGSFTMPYSALMTYRQGKAFASVKGYNQYVWDYESGRGENNMGRYLSFGTLITMQGDERDGFKGLGMDMNDGYHWGFLPGATTKALPVEKLLYYTKPNAKYTEGTHRNFSESTFASGLAQDGGNGIYAIDLQDNVGPDADVSLYDSTFRAKKSYFFIGNEIICLGSDISNGDNRYSTVTTLFQYRVDQQHPTFYNGKSIGAGLSVNQKVKDGYFTDQNGLQYIVRGGQNIVIEQNEQSSFKLEKDVYQKVSSPHVKAYLDHGTAPDHKGYEYEILLNTSNNDMAPYLKTATYDVLQKNTDAHIIYHHNTGITAYAIFTAKKQLKGSVIETDTPLLAMFKEPGDYSVLTIANPDLKQEIWKYNMSRMPEDIVNARSKGTVVALTLKGEWYAAKSVDELQLLTHQNGNTLLKIYCKDGKSIDIPLQKR